MVEILWMKFDQYLCLNFDMNSTLGSVVPLAMFLYIWNPHLLFRDIMVGGKIIPTNTLVFGLFAEILKVRGDIIHITAAFSKLK